MRRVATILAVLAAAAGFALLAGAAGNGDDSSPEYKAVFDNAFGLIKGGDLKIAGVRAGKITDLELDDANRALVSFKITQTGFGSLRTDVRCDSRPQSLIGEYFVDCLPGTAPEELKPGSTIPVERTSSTVAPDLVNNILREPYRERLSLLVNSLGAAVAGNSKNLNDAIRRANPALRETDKVLKTLADQNKILRDLTTNADRVITDLADNRKDVSRWVVEAGQTATASAERRDDIALGFKRLPAFLEELKPTMTALGRVAGEQAPALANLNSSADQLNRFFEQLAPFSKASLPAFKSLGRASETGNEAVKSAKDTVDLLDQVAKGTPELGKNLAIVLEHLDSREHAVEEDPRSPTGKGYTGIEALLRYVFDQVQSVNLFDSTQHILKVAVFEGPCADYADVEHIKADNLEEQCGARLGPNAPGLNYPDPTKLDAPATAKRQKKVNRYDDHAPIVVPQAPVQAPKPQPALPKPQLKLPPILPKITDLPKQLNPLGGITNRLGLSARSRRSQTRLLDYLFAP